MSSQCAMYVLCKTKHDTDNYIICFLFLAINFVFIVVDRESMWGEVENDDI